MDVYVMRKEVETLEMKLKEAKEKLQRVESNEEGMNWLQKLTDVLQHDYPMSFDQSFYVSEEIDASLKKPIFDQFVSKFITFDNFQMLMMELFPTLRKK